MPHRRSRTRGVAKVNFGTPMLHGAHFFLSSAPSVGVRFSHLTTPPQRECDFFHFFNTSPARIKKINRIASRSHGLDESERKARKANRHQNFAYPRRLRLGRVFRIVKNVITPSRIVRIPQGKSRITSSALICALREFHQNRSNPWKKTRNFNDSHSALFVQHCIDIIFDKLARSSGRFQFTMLSKRNIKQRPDICMACLDPECGALTK